MTFASNASNRLRGSTGLLITIAVHAGMATLALVGLGVVSLPKAPPPPIVTVNVDPPPVQVEKLVPPKPMDVAVPIDSPVPVIEIATVPDTPRAATVIEPTINSTLVVNAGTGDAILVPPPPLGPTVTATLDQRYARDFQPPYPEQSRRMGEEGTVVVRVIVGPDGRVSEAHVARSSGFPRLDAAAVARALAKWRFLPAQRDGTPVAAEREITVRFRLAQG